MSLESLPVLEHMESKVNRKIQLKIAQKPIMSDGIDASNLDYGVIRTNSGLIYVGRYELKNRGGI